MSSIKKSRVEVPPLVLKRKLKWAGLVLQENAVNGEHLWLETNVSGDLCYLGEENCQVRFAVSMSHGAHLVFPGNSRCLRMAGMEGE